MVASFTLACSNEAPPVSHLEDNRDFVLKEVMASDIVTGSVDGYTREWDINGEHVTLGVKKN